MEKKQLIVLLAGWTLVIATTSVLSQCTDSTNDDGKLEFIDYDGTREILFISSLSDKRRSTLYCCVSAPSGLTHTVVWSGNDTVQDTITGSSLYITRSVSRKGWPYITCSVTAGTQTISRRFFFEVVEATDFRSVEPKCPTTSVSPGPGDPLRFLLERHNAYGDNRLKYTSQNNPLSTYNILFCCATPHDKIIWYRHGVDEDQTIVTTTIVNNRSSSCAAGGGHFYDNDQIYAYLASSKPEDIEIIECDVIRGNNTIRAGVRSRPFSHNVGSACSDPPKHLQTTITAELGGESVVEVAFAECPWDEVNWFQLDERTGNSSFDMGCLSKTDRFQTFLRFKVQEVEGSKYVIRMKASDYVYANNLYCLQGSTNGVNSRIGCNYKEVKAFRSNSATERLKCGATPSGNTTWTLNGTEILQETSGELTITPELHGIITCRPTQGSGEMKAFRVIYLADEYCPSLDDTKYAPLEIASFRSCDTPPSLTYCCAYGADGVRWKAYGDTSNKVLGTGQTLENVDAGAYVCEAYKGTATDVHISVVEDAVVEGAANAKYAQLSSTKPTVLSCNFESPTSSYEWTFSGYPIENYEKADFRTSVGGLLLTVPPGFAGRFGCRTVTCKGDVGTKSFVIEDWTCPARADPFGTNKNIVSPRWNLRYFIPDCESLTLQCCAKDIKTIEWSYNGVALPAVSSGNSATVGGVNYTNELRGQSIILSAHPPGDYSCVVKESNNKLESLVHTLASADKQAVQYGCGPNCTTTDANFFIPAGKEPTDQYAEVGDTVTWTCSAQNRCRFDGGFRANWDMYLNYVVVRNATANDSITEEIKQQRSCTVDISGGSGSIQCGNRLGPLPSCEVYSTGKDPALCDERYSGTARTWSDRYSQFVEQTLTIKNVTASDFTHSFVCVLFHLGNPRPRDYVYRLIEGQPPTPKPVIENPDIETPLAISFGAALPLIIILAVLIFLFYWPLKLFIQRFFAKALPTKYHTFLCYSATNPVDEEAAITLMAGTLEQHGFSVCIPPRDFLIGAAQSEEISRSLQESSSLLALVTPSFLETGWCDLALDLALKSNLPIVIILYEIDKTVWQTYQKKKLDINLTYQYGVKTIQWPSRRSPNGKSRSGGYMKKRAKDQFWYELRASLPNFSTGEAVTERNGGNTNGGLEMGEKRPLP